MTASGVPGPAGPAAVPMIVERDPPVPMDDGLILRGAGPAWAPPGPRPGHGRCLSPAVPPGPHGFFSR